MLRINSKREDEVPRLSLMSRFDKNKAKESID